ncbi:unnamed protein product [Adineta steineri]|uniref:G domain-containing protein n=1 Tax=Adineta steineri TaxID=433720 RepID=A0A819VMP8_9BILA|nr:unnamed protein product [Adineta steineri]
MAEYSDLSENQLSSFAKPNDNNIVGDIINLLQLDDAETKIEIMKDLLTDGRQSLVKHKRDIIPKLYTTEMDSADGKLIALLKKYFQQQWEKQYDSTNAWFISFIKKCQDEKNPELYERVLTRTAEYGNKYMRDCPTLSIILQLLFEHIDNECLEKTNTFNDLWFTVTNKSLLSITNYSDYIDKEVMNTQLDKNQSTLFLALREYYRPKLFSLLKEHNISEEQTLYDLALDSVTEHGWLIGIQAIQQEVPPKYYDRLLETIRFVQQQQQEQTQQTATLVNTQPEESLIATPTTVDEQQVSASAANIMIRVFFKRTGESINVPVSLTITIKDIIKYACEKSVLKAEIDYNNYCLSSVCFLQTTNSNKLISHDGKTKFVEGSEFVTTPKDLQATLSTLCHGLGTLSLPVQHVSNKNDKFTSQKEDLANNYQQLQNKIHEISIALTRDPILRRNISEKFSEINIIVCGAPRVGKSTLINAICQQKLAKTSPGLNSCTNMISCYYLKGNVKIGDETINYQYNFWDTPGLENWDQEAIRKSLKHIKQKPKSDIICMIYCASPGSFAKLPQVDWMEPVPLRNRFRSIPGTRSTHNIRYPLEN